MLLQGTTLFSIKRLRFANYAVFFEVLPFTVKDPVKLNEDFALEIVRLGIASATGYAVELHSRDQFRFTGREAWILLASGPSLLAHRGEGSQAEVNRFCEI
ncbi:hypothetical protein llap_18289 [Limosa lapponica baueri]|uniref:Uncharacterized protein n=1 Tax=Limosa lapponica baueri TaxID=1758121 RepID=A0A2I0TC86_LIMLA|nr:hypothetical protein llap_18289 [Limosa lapponica baueri]